MPHDNSPAQKPANRRQRLEAITRALLCSLALTLAASCGGGGDPVPPANQVGPAGGTVMGPNGVQVVVPPGALGAPVVITVTPTAARPLPPGMQGLGTVYDLGPAGTSFAVPVTVTLPLDPAQVPAGGQVRMLHELHVAGTDAWEALPGLSIGATSVSAQTTSFSHLTLTLGNSPPSITRQPTDVAVVAPSGASFSVAFTGTPGFDVQWERSNDGGVTWTDAVAVQAVNAAPGGSVLLLGSTSAVAASLGGDHGALFRASIYNIETPLFAPVRSSVVTLTVSATPMATATLAVTVIGSGSVTSVPAGIDCGADCNEAYAQNTTVALTPAAAAGFVFSAWSGDADCSDGALTMSAARACTATFTATPPVATTAERIAAGSDFSLAVTAAGVPYSWGSDGSGTLGNGGLDVDRNTPAALGTIATAVRAVVASSLHGVALLANGEPRAWGYNTCTFDGTGSANIFLSSTPVLFTGFSGFVSASTGSDHLLLLGSPPLGKVLALGCNFSGQLGFATGTPIVLFVAGLPSITAVAAGGSLSLALDTTGNVWSWGSGALGDGSAIGQPSAPGRSTPMKIIDRTGTTPIIAIAAGRDHALALASDGAVLAWGKNTNGKLGDGTDADRLTPVPTLLTSGSGITAIGAGRENSIALRGSDGVVLTWGINETGQLGNGSLSPGFRPQPAPVINLTGVVEIAFGSGAFGHAMARKSDGTVWAWGHNDKGQLGSGSTAMFSATPMQATGLNLN